MNIIRSILESLLSIGPRFRLRITIETNLKKRASSSQVAWDVRFRGTSSNIGRTKRLFGVTSFGSSEIIARTSGILPLGMLRTSLFCGRRDKDTPSQRQMTTNHAAERQYSSAAFWNEAHKSLHREEEVQTKNLFNQHGDEHAQQMHSVLQKHTDQSKKRTRTYCLAETSTRKSDQTTNERQSTPTTLERTHSESKPTYANESGIGQSNTD